MKKLYKNWHKQSANFVAKCLSARAAFLAALADPVVAQKQVLDNIIAKNLGTKFAEAHFFTQIKTVKDFQKAVPIRSYEQFESWIEQEINQKGGVLASDKPARWLKTSGSTGNSKKIPYSKYWMEEYRTPALEVLWGNYIHYTPELLAHPFAALDTQTVREVPTEFLNGIPYQGITNRNSPLSATDWQPPWYDAPWFTADVPSDYDAKMYYRLRYFLEQDLRAILAINPSTLIAFKHHLMKNLPQLIDDIHDGTIKGKKISQPNQGIAKKITDIVQQPEFSFKDIWPNLDLISCWTSASAKLYIPKLQKLFPGVKLLPFMSCGTEGIVTLPIDDHFVTGPLAVNQGFYEFLPASVDIDKIINSERGVDALLFNELQLGEEYHLIMTQGSGMCRYAVGDIYKVTGFYNGVPRIEYSRRNGCCFSFTGEKLTEQQLVMALNKVVDQYKLDSGLFMCIPVWDDLPHYNVLIEMSVLQHSEELRKLVEHNLDQIIRAINEEYDSKRKTQRLDRVKTFFIKKGIIESILEQEKNGKNATQFKYNIFQKDDVLFQKVLAADGYEI